MATATPQLDEHNKAEYPPMHTAESDVLQTILNHCYTNNSHIIYLSKRYIC